MQHLILKLVTKCNFETPLHNGDSNIGMETEAARLWGGADAGRVSFGTMRAWGELDFCGASGPGRAGCRFWKKLLWGGAGRF